MANYFWVQIYKKSGAFMLDSKQIMPEQPKYVIFDIKSLIIKTICQYQHKKQDILVSKNVLATHLHPFCCSNNQSD